MKLYFLEFILTTKCNQQCDYCNVYNINKKETSLEIDLDFLNYVLKYIPDNTKIELCGGEPGILNNLDQAFNIVNSNPKVKAIQIMSNGLVRKNGYEWLENENVNYNEHLIKEITDKNIIKFYDELDFIEKPRWKYVIVTTYKTIKSLLENYDYYKNLGLFSNKFWYKLMNPKTNSIEYFLPSIKDFFVKLKNEQSHDYTKYTLDRIDFLINREKNFNIKKLCGMNSPLPTINFETKELIHCGAFLKHSRRYKFNKESFNRHLECSLFTLFEQYCKDCYIFKDVSPQSITSCKKGIYYNQ